MPAALVTGATGFVGSNLVTQLLKSQWQVGGFVRNVERAKSLQSLGATLHLGTLSDAASLEQAMADVDTVFHVAGRVRALRDQEFMTDNVEGTRNVAQAAAAQSKPPVVVLVSSVAAGGPNKPNQPRRESDVDQPVSAYGKSKLAAERAAAQLADEVPISIIRPPIIFGPADKASLAIFRGIKLSRLHPVPGYRRFPVSLVYVADLCDAMIRIAERGKRIAPINSSSSNGAVDDSAGIYYVAAERTIAYGELGKLAAQSLGCKGIAVPIPRALFWLAGGAMELVGQIRRQPSLLNLDKIREAVASAWECSDERIRHELDYQPAAPLEQRFAETAQWYRQQGWL
ncbi:MAG: NAD-dependent epimerase/dehydratase family protein [Aeoliella sp.]